MSKNIIVLKFGGSVLRQGDLPNIVTEVYRHIRKGKKVIAVASAYNGVTEGLLSRAHLECPADDFAVAEFVSQGEIESSTDINQALGLAGIRSTYLSPKEIGLLATGPALDSDPTHLSSGFIDLVFEDHDAIVIPGFIGSDLEGRTRLLGRGGSDLSALFIANKLGAAECRLIKDTDGLCEWDPKAPGEPPRTYQTVTWQDAMQLDVRVLQPKALRFAAENKMSFYFASLGSASATQIGAAITTYRAETIQKPLQVALFGSGTVGLGVLQRLVELDDRFKLEAVVSRDTKRELQDIKAKHLTEWQDGAEVSCDVVIELFGGIQPALDVIRTALQKSRHVVTANKAVIAEYGEELAALARANGVTLTYSAAVGGSAPMLEAVRNLKSKGIAKFRGVVNGTTNFIIDQVLAGASYEMALAETIHNGYAEADPSGDIEGYDAANKLVLLAREAFGTSVALEDVKIEGIRVVNWLAARNFAREGKVLRLVAKATSDGVYSVAPTYLSAEDPLAGAVGSANVLEIELSDGTTHLVGGLGAGRLPTTEAVIADLFDISREARVTPLVALEAR